ncbi:ABC transporter ATP-binding protein [Kribbia dieselivorans]|uniref:ABC transporter ATP-binding protein n=1 Tax=Kribbia dieselivorans TaxID=331526 RepID=UPI0008384E58|nr:ABC transporter ATP-binding protein [Kribbia dieselivorans]
MSMQPGWMMMRSLSKDGSVRDAELPPGTTARVLSYAKPLTGPIVVFLVVVVLGSMTVVATPLLLARIVDDGVTPGNHGLVTRLAVLVAVLAVAEALLGLVQRWMSSRIGEGLIYVLRTQVFDHVLRQPIAFFTRAQTGALVSRVNSDVMGAQQAFTTVLSSVVSNAVSLVLIVGAMAALSWQLTLGALLLVPVFLVPARWVGQRLSGLTREQMNLNADMGSRMTERFNVAGALLVKLFGHHETEHREYADRAARVRDIGVRIAWNRSVFMVSLGLVAALATAMVYGFGGHMAINGSLSVGSLIALATLLGRLYGPLTAISNVRVDVMTALVSFSRIFEVLDLPPMITEKPGARPLPEGPLSVEFDHVSFAYPTADQVSLTSLEATAHGDRLGGGEVLTDITATVQPGQMVALVGPSGAGKTTLTTLVARLYDPSSGAVRLGGVDLRDATLDSVRDAVGVVTQEAHLFHDTIRANLAYAKPDATDAEMEEALRSAQVWNLVERLPSGLDTVVGDRGHRLSGGEKQRMAVARLLLKAPRVVVLDEATAHLDSESEAALQHALDHALHGRTSLVIAHRLSTVRDADRILVVDEGRIVEQGQHEDLLAADGVYAELYRTQFRQARSVVD